MLAMGCQDHYSTVFKFATFFTRTYIVRAFSWRHNRPCCQPTLYLVISLPGAAIEEGTLKPGDRLLEVNGVSVDGMSQSEVVALLRNAPLDSLVSLVS